MNMKAIVLVLMVCLLSMESLAITAEQAPQGVDPSKYVPKEVGFDEEGNIIIIDPTNIYDEYIAEQERKANTESMCEDEDNNPVPCDPMLDEKDRLKAYYSVEQYDPSKDYTFLTFPIGWGSTKLYKQKINEYYGVEITEEELIQKSALGSRMGWGLYYVEVNGENVSYDFDKVKSILNDKTKEAGFPDRAEEFQALWSKIYKRIQENNNSEGIGNTSVTEESSVTFTGSEEKLGKEISETATSTKKPSSIIQGIIGYFKALFKIGK